MSEQNEETAEMPRAVEFRASKLTNEQIDKRLADLKSVGYQLMSDLEAAAEMVEMPRKVLLEHASIGEVRAAMEIASKAAILAHNIQQEEIAKLRQALKATAERLRLCSNTMGVCAEYDIPDRLTYELHQHLRLNLELQNRIAEVLGSGV